MRHINQLTLHLVVVSLIAFAMSGCATTTDPNTVSYPDGSYRMYGNGTTVPYYWVWVPNGTTAPDPAVPPTLPPNQPATVVQSGVPGVAPTVVSPPPTTVAFEPEMNPAPTPAGDPMSLSTHGADDGVEGGVAVSSVAYAALPSEPRYPLMR